MDKQMKNLAAQIRRQGIAPERDLWQGIDRAIDQMESEKRSGGRFQRNAWYRMFAVAATLILLLGSGYFGGLSPNDQVALTAEAEVDGNNSSLLQSLNQTISDLDKAMALDPENIKLTRLSLMTHKSRADLLRVGTRR